MTTLEAPARAQPPYKGLEYFREDDTAFFFGREDERDLVVANLKSRRVSLLYGPSGVGKSSLVRAGVAAALRQEAQKDYQLFGAPEFVPVVFSNWRDDPVPALVAAIGASAGQFGVEVPADSGLVGASRTVWRASGASLLVVLDQFEEYFLYRRYHRVAEGPGSFFNELVDALNEPSLAGAFLLSMREDMLSELDLFKGRVPNLYDCRRRLSPLGLAAGRQAIEGPLEEHNRDRPPAGQVRIEPELVTDVLEGARSGVVQASGAAGVGTLNGRAGTANGGDAIEAPYLQLVMTKVWEAEQAAGSSVLRWSTLERLGGAATILRTHLDATLGQLSADEQATAADVFHQLVTPSGSKIVHSVPDLVDYTNHSGEEIRTVLERLSAGDTRIVRPVPPPPGVEGPPRYEIFHDVLAPAILAWRSRQESARLESEKRQAEHELHLQQRRARIAWASAAVALVACLIAVFLGISANNAKDAATAAKDLVQSASLLPSDPSASVAAALAAVEKDPTTAAGNALTQATEDDLELRAFDMPGGGLVESVAFSPDGQYLAAGSGNGEVGIWDLAQGSAPPQVFKQPFNAKAKESFVYDLTFSPDGRQLAVAGGYNGATPGFAVFADKGGTWSKTSEVAIGKDAEGGIYDTGVAYDPAAPYVALSNNAGQLCWYSTPSYSPVGACSAVSDQGGEAGAALSFSASGDELAISQGGNGAVVLTRGAGPGGTPFPDRGAAFYPPDGNSVTDVSLDPAGTELVTTVGGAGAYIWRVTDTKAPVASVHTGSYTSAAAFNGTGTELVATGDNQSSVWQASSAQEVTPLSCLCGIMYTAQFDRRPAPVGLNPGLVRLSPSMPVVATGSANGQVQLWDAQPRQLLASDDLQDGAVYQARLFPSLGEVAAATADGVSVYDLASGQQWSLAGKSWAAADFGASDEAFVAWTQKSKSYLEVWRLRAGRSPLALWGGHTNGDPPVYVALDPVGHWLVAAFNTNDIELYNTETKADRLVQVGARFAYGGGINSMQVNRAGTALVLAYQNGFARLWSMTREVKGTAAFVRQFDDPDTAAVVESAQFSPDGTRVVLADNAGNAPVFSTATGKLVGTVAQGDGTVLNSATFGPNDNEVLTAGNDGAAELWGVLKGERLGSFGPYDQSAASAVDSVQWARYKGKWVVMTAGDDGDVHLWSTQMFFDASDLGVMETIARAEVADVSNHG